MRKSILVFASALLAIPAGAADPQPAAKPAPKAAPAAKAPAKPPPEKRVIALPKPAPPPVPLPAKPVPKPGIYEIPGPVAPGCEIDRLVFAKLKQLGVEPALCSDAVFLRRVHMDVIGTLPTAVEAREFLNDPDTETKRARLIDRLLERDEFAVYWSMKWGDILRIKAEFPVNLWPNAAQAYDRWVKESIAGNKPYDQFARELLTSSGSNFRVGPVNFYRATQDKTPEGIAAAVALTLMGSRADFWEEGRLAGMAVFFSEVGYKPSREWKEELVYWDPYNAGGWAAYLAYQEAAAEAKAEAARQAALEKARAEAARKKAQAEAAKKAAAQKAKAEAANKAAEQKAKAEAAKKTVAKASPPAKPASKPVVKPAPKSTTNTSSDSNPKPDAEVEPVPEKPGQRQQKTAVFPDGTKVALPLDRDPREVFADWLITPENPWFTRNIANRLWSWLLGRGIIHEPDDLREDNPPSNPALLAYLEKEMIAGEYDMVRMYRMILNSRTYQLSALPKSTKPEAEANFASYRMRRLPAEVLIDNVNAITGTTDLYTSAIPEPFTYIPKDMPAIGVADGSITSSFLALFGRSARATGMERERINTPQSSQMLHMLNSTHIRTKIERGPKILAIIGSRKKTPEIAEDLYLTILSRFPTEEEVKRIEAYGKGASTKTRDEWIDVTWALINSTEALYRH